MRATLLLRPKPEATEAEAAAVAEDSVVVIAAAIGAAIGVVIPENSGRRRAKTDQV